MIHEKGFILSVQKMHSSLGLKHQDIVNFLMALEKKHVWLIRIIVLGVGVSVSCFVIQSYPVYTLEEELGKKL